MLFRSLVLARKARRPLHSTRCEQSPRGSAAPQIHMQVGPRKSTQDRQGPPSESPRGHGLDYGRRPQAAWTVHCTPRRPRTLVPAPWGHADARRPCATNPGPSLVTPCTPIGNWGPFWACGQAPLGNPLPESCVGLSSTLCTEWILEKTY